MHFNQKDIVHEFTFVTSRSSGKGGQHVNKTES
ncbi:MAG: aminoacyl-tRNA hydrolase, partial [Flavobacteriales bacterium]|nr:aminoacyl-tRNA hydrolase [Flavobacteriales bacterium]